MNALVSQFLDHITLECGLSPNTREAYSSDLLAFCGFLARRHTTSFNEVTRKQILEFLMSEKRRGLGTSSISRRLIAIKVFFRYLAQENLLARNVTEVMDAPKLWKVLPSFLSYREIERLLNAITGKSRYILRDRALLELMYASGMRVSECVELKVDDVHFDSGYLYLG